MHAASPLASSPNAHDDELTCHRFTAGGGFGRPHHIQTPTHSLNSLDFTLLNAHLPDKSHSDFPRLVFSIFLLFLEIFEVLLNLSSFCSLNKKIEIVA